MRPDGQQREMPGLVRFHQHAVQIAHACSSKRSFTPATVTQMVMDHYTSKTGMLWYCIPVMPSPPLPPLALADCIVVAADRERTKAEAAASHLLPYELPNIEHPSSGRAGSGWPRTALPELPLPVWVVCDCWLTFPPLPPLPPTPAPNTVLSTVGPALRRRETTPGMQETAGHGRRVTQAMSGAVLEAAIWALRSHIAHAPGGLTYLLLHPI